MISYGITLKGDPSYERPQKVPFVCEIVKSAYKKSTISWFAKIEDCQADTAKKQYQHKLDSICYRPE